jgi:hypothetical protein
VISALAAKWNSAFAIDAARKISSLSSVYCGPATAGWIAAVWNQSKGRQYDLSRLKDKKLFPDGPRMFHGRIPGFQLSLDDLLLRESNGELMLSRHMYYRIDTIHQVLAENELPVVIRLRGPDIRSGLHYVVVYRSELFAESGGHYTYEMYRQDNGLFGAHNSGLSKVTLKSNSHLFVWGAKRVIMA